MATSPTTIHRKNSLAHFFNRGKVCKNQIVLLSDKAGDDRANKIVHNNGVFRLRKKSKVVENQIFNVHHIMESAFFKCK